MRRVVIPIAALLVSVGVPVAAAGVTAIDGAAAVGRTAYRIAPPFRPDLDPNERVALEAVEIINLERNRRGLPNYLMNESVTDAAMAHAADMAARREMVHLGSDGSDTGTRLERAGFVWRTWGENIGAGFRTPQPLIDAWMASDIHRPLLLGENTYVGVGVAATPDGVPYWALVVAS